MVGGGGAIDAIGPYACCLGKSGNAPHLNFTSLRLLLKQSGTKCLMTHNTHS